MSSPIYLPLFVGDMLSSTRVQLLSPELVGAYMLLLMNEWQMDGCLLPNDDKVLAKLSRLGRKWGDKKDEVLCFFEVVNEGKSLRNNRLYAEWVKSNGLIEVRKQASQKANAVRWREAKSHQKGSLSESQTDSVTDPKRIPNGSQTDSGWTPNHNHNHNQESTPAEVVEDLVGGGGGDGAEIPTVAEVVAAVVGMGSTVTQEFVAYWVDLRERNGDWVNGQGRLKNWRRWVVSDWQSYGPAWVERRKKSAAGAGAIKEVKEEIENNSAELYWQTIPERRAELIARNKHLRGLLES